MNPDEKPTVSPMQPAKHYYPYEPNDNVMRWAKHVFGTKLFVIRRLQSEPQNEAYQCRYLDENKILVIDIFYPEEFSFV